MFCLPESDEDPFERLRIERQQERIQRMNNYVERHFGPNFQIILQSLVKPDHQKPKQLKEKEIFEDAEEVDKEDITEEATLVDQSIEQPTQKSKMVVTWYPENLESTKNTNDFGQSYNMKMSDRVSTRATQTSELSLTEEQNIFAAGIKSDSDIPLSATDALTIDASHFSEPSNLLKTANYPSEQELLWLSKATSPMGSARSVSTQSSTQTDEWELMSLGSSPVVGEHRVDIEEPKEKEPHSKSE